MSVIVVIAVSVIAFQYSGKTVLQKNPAQWCFETSYTQVSDSMLSDLEATAGRAVTRQDPFVMLIQLIEHFSNLEEISGEDYITLPEILRLGRGNVHSYIIAICVAMQKWGWDVQYLYNGDEKYIGINFEDNWVVRQGHWVEVDGRKYYLKVFDDKTPVGELLVQEPAATYQCLEISEGSLKPFPLITHLPEFSGGMHSMQLSWKYGGSRFGVDVDIFEEQADWTHNLPSCLYGMAASGIAEIAGLDFVDRLKSITRYYDEYERVNILLKFCQSENIFSYDSTMPVISVSRQLVERVNDCDGRSVLLYSLLVAVLGYPDSNILFVEWPYHVALALKPMTEKAKEVLSQKGVLVGEDYYILDPSYIGDTAWGSAVDFVNGECRLIFP